MKKTHGLWRPRTAHVSFPAPLRQGAKLSQDAYWCRKYAKANAVALRKILKKHDKVAGNSRGRDFLRDSWQSHGREGVGTFLHSPLLDELKAIQVRQRVLWPRARVYVCEKFSNGVEEEEQGVRV